MQERRPAGDPAAPPADVLSAGPEREPRRLPRWVPLLAVAVLLLAAGARGVGELRQERAEQARRAAAAADRVDLRAEVTGMAAGEGTGRASASVRIVSTGGPRPRSRVTGVQLVGPGLTPADYPQPVFSALPAGVRPQASVDCAGAARRPFDVAAVVVTVLPASQVPREQRLPVPSREVREAVLAACGLPDPRADLVVEASGTGRSLLLFVAGVPRSRAVLRIEDVTVPGFEVAPPAGQQLPVTLPSIAGARTSGTLHAGTLRAGTLLGVQLRVEQCARARPAAPVVVRLTEDGQPVTVVAGPAQQRPQPGAVPVDRLLEELVEQSC